MKITLYTLVCVAVLAGIAGANADTATVVNTAKPPVGADNNQFSPTPGPDQDIDDSQGRVFGFWSRYKGRG
ncbi:unnamed protein product [Orchesella dallaii]|uniref:Uncharacterized protein n=1 Tax=Orchesella dallaii TaxID=48710 RepID=A0ABP1PZW5_9HEXA